MPRFAARGSSGHDALAVLLVREDPDLGRRAPRGCLPVVNVSDEWRRYEEHALPGAAVRPPRNPSFIAREADIR